MAPTPEPRPPASLRPEVRRVAGVELVDVAIRCSDPDGFLAATAPYLLEVTPGPAGWQLGRVGVPGVLAAGPAPRPSPDPARPVVLRLVAEPDGTPVHTYPAWPGQARGAEIRAALAEADERAAAGADPAGSLERALAGGFEPRLALALAEATWPAEPRRAQRLVADALEVYPNFLPALRWLGVRSPDRALAIQATARALALGVDRAADARALEGLDRRFDPEAAAACEAAAAHADLRHPFREQWVSVSPRPDAPVSAEEILASARRMILRDGAVTADERAVYARLCHALGGDPGRLAADYAATIRDRGGLAPAAAPADLEPEELFRETVAAALRDGQASPDELEWLERVRDALSIRPEVARAAFRAARRDLDDLRPVIEEFFRAPSAEAARRLRDRFVLGRFGLYPRGVELFAEVLERGAADAPRHLSRLLPPLISLSRYPPRLVDAALRATRAAAAVDRAGRAAAFRLVRANPGDATIEVALAEGLRRAAATRAQRDEVLRALQRLLSVAVHPDRFREAHQETLAILRAGDEPAPAGPGAPPPRTSQARVALEDLRGAVAAGDKFGVLRALEALERGGVGATLVEEARTEACVAAAFHGWRDLLESCLAWDEDPQAPPPPWPRALRLLAAAELAAREGRRASLAGYRGAFEAGGLAAALSGSRAEYCRRRWACLSAAPPRSLAE